ncbi:hypothetical protein EUX98_g9121 [Antrodiella citrinella]|uniref:Uncharacterized protein n=1 Tax=Antrodiella citrinella TaxID=2447956 RepID=A0A4S4M053_9APHY|nr:hypothetical protein EUX98_g9121 [Antrodiella citrinella]
MHMDNYSRRIYPEDEMDVSGLYLMYRCFPEFTKKRMELQLPYPLPAEQRSLFDAEFSKDVASPSTQTGSGEIVVKEIKGKSSILGFWMFPLEEREPMGEVLIRLHSRQTSEISTNGQENDNTPRVSFEGGSASTSSHTTSEVDKLFARLQPPSAPISTSQSAHNGTPMSLLDALNGNAPLSPSVSAPASASSDLPRGLALLDSIFASVVPPPSHPLPPQPEEIQIVSPKPTSSALPQILNQDVIYSLLGLASDSSSRASSVAPSTPSSRKSHQRYEGDNEFSDSVHSDAGYSTSSTVADFDDPAVLSAGPSSSHNIPILSFSHSGSSDENQHDARTSSSRRVPGDMTPRVMSRPMDLSPTPNHRSQSLLAPSNGSVKGNTNSPLRSSPSSASVSTITNTSAPADSAEARSRTLIPFQADSDLWPYPRAPVDERDPEDSDIVELDFSDTRALSDPAVFTKKQQKQKQTGKRKSRRERAADRERERDAIEKSWDDPNNGNAQSVDMSSQPGAPSVPAPAEQFSSPLPPPPQVNGKHVHQNGTTNDGTTATNGSLSPDAARHVLLSALGVHPKPPAANLSRKQFVQEVLSLIYSDDVFVDGLYQDYCSRIN